MIPKFLFIREKITYKAILSACLICLTLFFVGTADAQVAGGASLRLIGTMQGSRVSGAVFQDGTGAQTFHELNSKLPDGSQLIKLRDDSISLKGADGTLYEMYISREKTAGSAASPQPSRNSPANVSPAPPQPSPAPPSADYVNTIRQRRHTPRPAEE